MSEAPEPRLSIDEFQLQRFEKQRDEAIAELQAMEPRRTCERCHHVSYPFVVTQNCWCDPDE